MAAWWHRRKSKFAPTRVEDTTDRGPTRKPQRSGHRSGHDSDETSPDPSPPPPAYRLLLVPVGLTMLIVVVVFVTTISQADTLVVSAQAADPSAPHAGILAQVWGRVAFGCLLAVSWPLALRQLGRGSTKVYARCRRVSILAAVLLLAVTLFDSGPVWLQIAHGLLTLAEIGIFAATMHPQMRAWYTTHR